MATRRVMSRMSSPGRLPFGKPAGSQPGWVRTGVKSWFGKHNAAPRLFWFAATDGLMAVLRRVYSHVEPFALTPVTPVAKAVTRSRRGYAVGAGAFVAPK